MSWLYSINHPYPRYTCCIVQHSAALLVRYPSLPKEFTSLLWAQIFCEKKFGMYWKFLRKKIRNVLENCVEKISKCTGKLCRKIVTRIRVWARIELFYTNTNTNHYHYHSRSRSHAPIQCNTAPIQCKRAKIPTFVLFHVQHRTNTVQNRSAQTLHRTNTVQHTVPRGTIHRAKLGMIIALNGSARYVIT